MLKYFILILQFFFSIIIIAQNNFTKYVNPFIGTGGHGHTYPGATVPHGMVQLSPDTRLTGWDGCSGYHYSDNFIYGFTHTHLSGVGCSDYGDILLMPTHGTPSPDNKIYGSSFSHKNEKASPGFYSVKLDDDDIFVELTTTARVGFHKYTFLTNDENNIILDLQHRDEVIESSLQIINNHTIAGLRRSKAWADNQYVYFVIEFNVNFIQSGIWNNDILLPSTNQSNDKSKNIKAFFTFNKKEVLAKCSISAVSIDGAQKNLEAEIPHWNFEKTKMDASKIWENELHKIEIPKGDKNELTIFYTALYHTMIVPIINMDVDGQYRGRDDKIHTAKGFVNYSVFSLWDTYRAAHPLYTIIDTKKTNDYIQSFLVQYQQGGVLPVWELSSCETNCMIGYHSVSVIADAYMKGIHQFDTKLALQAMKKSSTMNHFGLDAYMDHGFLETDDDHESVSKTLEYAYDDWCIAQYAKKIGSLDDYKIYIKRAQAYKNILDVNTGFMRPRKNGNWVSPFDPREVNNNFTEANSWQYSFYFPQDVQGYLKIIGGKEKLEKKLDALFAEPTQTTGRDQSDITGLIGQYAHGNEPSHHIAYLYNFVGKPYKTQEKVHQIMHEMYHNAPDGLAGNEDCGQMSAWYVLSALGIYPVTPATTDFVMVNPLFENAILHLENGKDFTINSSGNYAGFYIQTVKLNSSKLPYTKSYLDYNTIMNGGKINFVLGKNKSDFGSINVPTTAITDNLIVVNPIIDGGKMSFKKNTEISISSFQNVDYFYTLDGSLPTNNSKKYTSKINIDSTTIIKAIAINKKGEKSFVTTAKFVKAPNNWDVKYLTPYEPQYEAGGTTALIDGVFGTTNWRIGNWLGFQKNNAEVLIDLQESKLISTVSSQFLQDTRAWIIAPKKISIEVSLDGVKFTKVFSQENFLPIDDLNVQTKIIEANFEKTNARFVKLIAYQYGTLPAWHEGAGGDSHIFIGEIMIK